MKITNRTGPSMLPCGIPLFTGFQLHSCPFTLNLCLRPFRNCPIQFCTSPSTPYIDNFQSSLCCGTESNALAKSGYININHVIFYLLLKLNLNLIVLMWFSIYIQYKKENIRRGWLLPDDEFICSNHRFVICTIKCWYYVL